MGRRLLVLSVWLVALVLAGFQIWAIALSWSHQTANDWYWRPFALSIALAALVYVLMGMLVYRRRPENRVGPLLAMIGVTILIYQGVSEYALRGLVVAPGSLPAWPPSSLRRSGSCPSPWSRFCFSCIRPVDS